MAMTAPSAPATDSEQRALGLLVERTRMTRVDLAAALGLSTQGVKEVVDRLVARRVPINEVDQPTGRGGQPASVYVLAADTLTAAVSVDIGYHSVRIAVCDPNGNLISEVAENTEVGLRNPGSLAQTFEFIHEALRPYVEGDTQRALIGVGVAVAGPVNPVEGMLRSSADPGPWEAVDFAKEIRERLPADSEVEIEIDNDANLGALAEHRSGAAQGIADVVYLRWTAGVGAGLILGGRPYVGARGIAGELGHAVFPLDDKSLAEAPQGDEIAEARNGGGISEVQVCEWCRKRCLQWYAGTDAIVEDAQRRGVKFDTGSSVSRVRQVIDAAAHDSRASDAIAGAARHVGRTLAIVVDLLNPQLVVIGGVFGRDDYSLIVPHVQDAMRGATIQPSFRDARIVMAGYSGHIDGGSVLRGAAYRVFDRHLAAWLLR